MKNLVTKNLLICVLFALLCVVGGMGGCATRQPLPSVTDPTQRFEFPGYSFLPPQGKDWMVTPEPLPAELQRDGYLAMFFKKLPWSWSLHSVAATVRTINSPGKFASHGEFLQQLERDFKTMGPVGRNTVIASTISRGNLHGMDCLRYDMTMEDRGVPGYQGTVFNLDVHGFICPHPDLHSYIIDVAYSQRRLPEKQPVSVEAECEPFLKSLVFTRLQGPVVVATIPVRDPQLLTVKRGSVWVASSDGVIRIDPKTNSAIARIRAGKYPVGIALSDEAVWVANDCDGMVSRIDAETTQTVATISVGKRPISVTVGAESIWITNRESDTVMRINPQTNKIVATIPVIHPNGIAVGEGGVWVSSKDAVSHIDPATNKIVATIPVADSWLQGILVHEGSVWATNPRDGTVLRIDPKTNRVVSEINVGRRPSDLAPSPGTIWVTNYDDDTVSRIDSRTNSVAGKPIEVGRRPLGIAFGEGLVWVTNAYGHSVSRIQP